MSHAKKKPVPKGGEDERCESADLKFNPPRRRESDAMDLLLKLTHNKRMSAGSAAAVASGGYHNMPGEKSSTLSLDKHHECEETEDWYEELSDDHTSAFKEVFDMLDSAKTGILNADTLYAGLKRVDSDITKEEVENVLKILDKDGNGEIDLDEFLMHITAIGSAEENEEEMGKEKPSENIKYTRRQRLFFSALQKFNMKSEVLKLHAKKKEQPHVLSHYTDGVRLIGLTDKQLTLKFKRMQKAARSIKSPYAKPLNFVIPSGTSKMQNVRKTIGLNPSHVLQTIEKPNKLFFDPLRIAKSQKDVQKEIQIFVTEAIKSPSKSRNYKMPKISEVIRLKKEDAQRSKSAIRRTDEVTPQSPPPAPPPKKVRKRKHNGWIIPRTERDKVPLPVLKISGRRRLTIEDLPDIREKVKEAVADYYANLRKAFVRTACEHWEELYAHHKGSNKLLAHLTEVYRSYSPQKEGEVFVVCPWVPGPFRPVHHNHDKRHHTATTRGRSPDIKTTIQRPFSAMY